MTKVSMKVKKPKTTQYVSHCTSSCGCGDSRALREKYAGAAKPMRLVKNPAKMLKKMS